MCGAGREKVVRTHEGRHEPVQRAVVDVPGRADLLHHAIEHHADLVGDRERLLLVVRDIDRGDAEFLLQPPDVAPQVHPQLGIEVGQRLVHQQHLGADHQRPRQAHTLLLAAAELVRQPLGQGVELHCPEHLVHTLAHLLRRHLALHQTERDVVEHAQVREHRVVLEHHAHIALGGTQMADGLLAHQDVSGVLLVEAGNGAQQRGLAAAAGPQQGEEGTRRDVEIDVLQRNMRAIGFADVLDSDLGRRGHGVRWTDRITSCSAACRSTWPGCGCGWRRPSRRCS